MCTTIKEKKARSRGKKIGTFFGVSCSESAKPKTNAVTGISFLKIVLPVWTIFHVFSSTGTTKSVSGLRKIIEIDSRLRRTYRRALRTGM